MGIVVEERFEVDAGGAAVFAWLGDLPRVARCLPAAQVGDSAADGRVAVEFTVPLGASTTTFASHATLATEEHLGHYLAGRPALERRADARGVSKDAVVESRRGEDALAADLGGATSRLRHAAIMRPSPAPRIGASRFFTEPSKRAEEREKRRTVLRSERETILVARHRAGAQRSFVAWGQSGGVEHIVERHVLAVHLCRRSVQREQVERSVGRRSRRDW